MGQRRKRMMIRNVTVQQSTCRKQPVDLGQKPPGNAYMFKNLAKGDNIELVGVISFEEVPVSNISDFCLEGSLDDARVQFDAVIFYSQLFVSFRQTAGATSYFQQPKLPFAKKTRVLPIPIFRQSLILSGPFGRRRENTTRIALFRRD